jgi:superfamily II DNA or RNA helicase
MTNLINTSLAKTAKTDTPVTEQLVEPKSRFVELYDFQKACIKEIYSHIRNNTQRILLVAACATGKTTMASQIIYDATMRAKKPTRCVFLVSLNCLIDQAAETLVDFGIDCSVLQGNRKFNAEAQVVVASIQTIQSRSRKQEVSEILGSAGVIFADEAHVLCYNKAFSLIHDYYLKTGTVFIGLTATPWRTNPKEYLDQWFDVKVVAPQPPELVKRGKLVPCRAFGFGKTFDFSQIDIGIDGDYQIGQMEAQAIGKAALECVVKEYQRLASDRLAAAFCVSVVHAQKLCEAFNKAGVTAECLDGNTPYAERKAMFARLETGLTRVLCSVGTLTAGWNSRIVSCIICVRPTKSKALFFQIAGRGGRTYPGKTDYMILDFGDNIVGNRHGNPMGRQEYDTSKKEFCNIDAQRKTEKECPGCNSVVSVWSRVCPECGYEFGLDNEAEESEDLLEAELVEIFTKEDREKLKFFREAKRTCFKDWVNPDIAINQFLKEYGYIPPIEWHFEAVLTRRYSAKAKQRFQEWLQAIAPHEYWLKRQMELEFGTKEQREKRARGDFKKSNWWQILGVAKNASRTTVKAAYLELAKMYHPDVSDDPNTTKWMQVINAAWDEAVKHFERAMEMRHE